MPTTPLSFTVRQIIQGKSWDSSYVPPVLKPLAIIGGLVDSQRISLRTDGTYNFGSKPVNEKTHFVWRADQGAAPASWGSVTQWAGDSFSGELTEDITGPGMAYSFRQPVTNSSGTSNDSFLGRIDFSSSEAYAYKRRYNDYEAVQATTFMLPYVALEGELPAIGTRLFSLVSGANGLVIGHFSRDGANYVQFHPTDAESTVNKLSTDPAYRLFSTGERITYDVGSFESRGTVSNQREHNDKNNRFWSSGQGSTNNTYTQTGQVGISPITVTNENTGQANYTPAGRHNFIGKSWYDEEIVYRASSLDSTDGNFQYYRDGVLGQNLALSTRNNAFPLLYSQLRLDQFTRPTSFGEYYRYIDYVYFDTSYCRVVLANTDKLNLNDPVSLSTYKILPLPVVSWGADEIELVYMGLLPDWTDLFVVGPNNQVIAHGSRADIVDSDVPWQPSVEPTVRHATHDGFDGLFISGSNFSTEAKETHFLDMEDIPIGGRVPIFLYWDNPGTAQYAVAEDPDSPVQNKVMRLYAEKQTMDTMSFEFAEDKREVYWESDCRVDLIDFTGDVDAPQVKLFRTVDGTGKSSMQGRPISQGLTVNTDGGLSLGGVPVVGKQSWYAPGGFVQGQYLRYSSYINRGHLNETDGERVVKVGDTNYWPLVATPPPPSVQHYASPITGDIPPSSFIGEKINVITTEEEDALFYRRVAPPYFHRSSQTTEVRIASFYVADSRERVVIGDAPLWEECNHQVSQLLETVSRSRAGIRVKLRSTNRPIATPYLYVLNHDGLVSSEGVSLAGVI